MALSEHVGTGCTSSQGMTKAIITMQTEPAGPLGEAGAALWETLGNGNAWPRRRMGRNAPYIGRSLRDPAGVRQTLEVGVARAGLETQCSARGPMSRLLLSSFGNILVKAQTLLTLQILRNRLCGAQGGLFVEGECCPPLAQQPREPQTASCTCTQPRLGFESCRRSLSLAQGSLSKPGPHLLEPQGTGGVARYGAVQEKD